MNTKIPIRLGLLLLFVAGSTLLSGQSRDAGPDPRPNRLFSSELSLEDLANRAGTIFAGTVIKIEEPRDSETGENSCCVRITFLVDDGIRNAKSGETITIREWAGLWRTNSGERYRTGEKLLMLYYPANASGTTSPVGGTAGRFPIGTRDQIRLSLERKQTLLRSARLRGFELESNSSSTLKKDISSSDLGRALRLVIAENQ